MPTTSIIELFSETITATLYLVHNKRVDLDTGLTAKNGSLLASTTGIPIGMTIYVATSNPGKLRDFAVAAEGRISMEPLPGLKEIEPPHEDEPTFEGNARLKAIYYSRHAPGHIVVADDSGLEVDALNGAPGVRSARYADDMGFS